MRAILLEQIKGSFSKRIYGNAGDEVQIIGNFNEMILVTNKNGDRFYVRENQIKRAGK